VFSAAIALGLLGLGMAVSCSSKDAPTTEPPNLDAGVTFTPTACAFTLGAVEGFPNFERSGDGLGADPAPKHVHIGLGGNADVGKPGYADPSTTLSAGWQTDVATTGSKLRYGTSEATLDKTVDGISYVIPQELGSGPDEGVRFHEAHVCGLEPGRTYYYQVGGGPAGKELWSKTSAYTTGPAKGSKDKVVFGFSGDTRDDLGRSALPVWKAIGGRALNGGAKLMLFSGDFVLVGANQDMWNTWSTAADGFASSIFVAMAPGNHENEQMRYFAHSLMPGNVGKNFERYSSFDYGPVHVVMFDDYPGIVAPTIDGTDYRAEVLAWLDSDLGKANANRANVPWIVTFHHHGVYNSSSKTERAAERKSVHDAVAALYDKHQVNVDFAGHDHFYERSKFVVADAVATKGTTYIVCAAGGAPAYSTNPGNPLSEKIELYKPDNLEGIYGIVNADTTTFAIKIYKMLGAGGTSPADDTVVDSLDLTK